MKKNEELYYNEFKDKSTIISKKWKEFINEEWIKYFGFEATTIPSIIWRQEELLRKISKEFPVMNVGIIKIPANYNYNWHKDTNRGCGINMLLEHDESYTLFKEGKHKEYDNDFFIKLNYKPNTFYAFNTQKWHCVYNFNKPRYLFTIEFDERENKISYELICKWMKENNLK
jgi:hypothetical protein